MSSKARSNSSSAPTATARDRLCDLGSGLLKTTDPLLNVAEGRREARGSLEVVERLLVHLFHLVRGADLVAERGLLLLGPLGRLKAAVNASMASLRFPRSSWIMPIID
jgi:hypothetical protein